MIRYDIPSADVIARVRSEKANWIVRANARTNSIVANGRFNESSSIWSEIKPAFMGIQFNKCIFCERLIGSSQYSSVESDLDHFRPKKRVSEWPVGSANPGSSAPLGPSNSDGYYWLAYDLKNYAVSCKTCNTSLKSSAFPIFGVRGAPIATVSQLVRLEKPALCYPIGRSDADPSTLIEFVGTTAKPRGVRGFRKRRGQIIIEFFKLNDRDDLHVERAKNIIILGGYLEKIENGEDTARYEELVKDYLTDSQPHAACSRDFIKMWFDNNKFAKSLVQAAQDLGSKY